MITILGYGLGNIQAIANVYNRLHIPARIASTVGELADSTHLILPGVGAFDHAMQMFENSGMCDKVRNLVLEEGIPLLGICVGMQMLGSGSDEGSEPGLNWIPGKVRRFADHSSVISLPLPHMGWNDVKPVSPHPLFDNCVSDPRYYFLHSYYFDCDEADHCLATANYGFRFHCAIGKDNVYGVQFHPEKSHQFGVQLLKNFAETQSCFARV